MVFCFLCHCVCTPDPFPEIHFWTVQYRNNVSSRMANRYTRIFDAGGLTMQLQCRGAGQAPPIHCASVRIVPASPSRRCWCLPDLEKACAL